jgi:predicted metal-dependent phosphoesterase TrpH
MPKPYKNYYTRYYMMRDHIIDLHMHSVNSDGTYTTQEILGMLKKKGATLISFTDHDSVGSYKDLYEGKARLYDGVALIPGVELSCRVDGALRDILGYGISVPYIYEALEKRYSKEHRIEKQQHILKLLKDNCRKLGLKFDESIQVTEGKKAEAFVVMYNELNRYAENVEKYPFIANNTKFYWDYFSTKNTDFYVDETYDLFSFKEAVSLIHSAGGKAFLAHPFAYGMEKEAVDALVEEAVIAGIDGIELKHSSNKNDDVDNVRAYSKKYNLLCSGGTDFHGTTKPGLELVNAYGNVDVQYDDVSNWIFKERLFGGSGSGYADISELWT